MLRLNSISLTQFKNYIRRDFTFSGKVVCITGNNGVGKTNLLDAIHYLCFTRSYLNAQDSQNITYGYDGFRISGQFLRGEKNEDVTCTFRIALQGERGGKKEVILNQTPYNRFSRHLGYLPCVIVTPDDAILIGGGSEQRRRFIDTMLTQIDAAYLDHLIAYQKILLQRNALLKKARESGTIDEALLGVMDAQLSRHGDLIYEKRKAFMPGLMDTTTFYYRQIAQMAEQSDVQYQSSLHSINMEQLLHQNLQRDMMMQRTTDGIHRDDLIFALNTHPVKQSASQGQRKNFLFALKLAQYDILKKAKNRSPLLLLDDIFEKLDHHRTAHLIHLISGADFGQVFISDTGESRLKTAFAAHFDQVQMIRL